MKLTPCLHLLTCEGYVELHIHSAIRLNDVVTKVSTGVTLLFTLDSIGHWRFSDTFYLIFLAVSYKNKLSGMWLSGFMMNHGRDSPLVWDPWHKGVSMRSGDSRRLWSPNKKHLALLCCRLTKTFNGPLGSAQTHYSSDMVISKETSIECTALRYAHLSCNSLATWTSQFQRRMPSFWRRRKSSLCTHSNKASAPMASSRTSLEATVQHCAHLCHNFPASWTS
jgi:hypothetical protein